MVPESVANNGPSQDDTPTADSGPFGTAADVPLHRTITVTEEAAMNAIVIYDSLHGNTQRVAATVAQAMAPLGDVHLYRVDELPADARADAWVIGGPTHAHGMSKPLSAFLAHLERHSLDGVPAVTFDTRYRFPRLFSGSAAHSAARHLRRAGCHVVGEPKSFFVQGGPKPADAGKADAADEHLVDGELERAREWGATLVELLTRG
jgi:flavodoxin